MCRFNPSGSCPRRGWRLVLAGLLLTLPGLRPLGAAAQGVPPPGRVAADSGAVLVLNDWYLPRYRPSATSGADTTGALLVLFRKRRFAGCLFTVPAIAGLSLTFRLASTDQYGRQQVAKEAISPPLGLAVLAGTLVGFIAHASYFSKERLLTIDRAYAAGRPLPARYRRLLRARHFAEADLLRTAIAQQRARQAAGAEPR